jgi:hypothetical protein
MPSLEPDGSEWQSLFLSISSMITITLVCQTHAWDQSLESECSADILFLTNSRVRVSKGQGRGRDIKGASIGLQPVPRGLGLVLASRLRR